MMFDSPIVGNGDIGMTFCGPPEHTTMFLASNQFWTSNDNVDKPVGAGGGSEYYTQARIGDVQLLAPAMAGAAYHATQELFAARVNATYNQSGAGQVLRLSSVIAANDNVVMSEVTSAQDVNVTLVLTVGGSWAYGATLPSAVGFNQSTHTLWATRDSVADRSNAVTLNRCYVGGQLGDSQLFAVENTTGNATVTLGDSSGRCLLAEAASATHPDGRVVIGACGPLPWKLVPSASSQPALPAPPGYKALPTFVGGQPQSGTYKCKSIATCVNESAALCNANPACGSFAICGAAPGGVCGPDGGKRGQWYNRNLTRESYSDPPWNLYCREATCPPTPPLPPLYLLKDGASGRCASVVAGYLALADCDSASTTRWSYNATSKHLFDPNLDPRDDWDHSWGGGGGCATFVEPNPLVVAGVGVRLVDAAGAAVAPTSTTVGNNSVACSLTLAGGAVYHLLTTVPTAGDCYGCAAHHDHLEGTAQEMLDDAVARSAAALQRDHAAWWVEYWQASQVDLGPLHSRVEGFYYGMQYQIGSASRPGKIPPGLWGPWLTTETPGWMGDYTLNYNYEANFYGVFSDNRPWLADNYYRPILNAIDVGRFRAGMQRWGSGSFGTSPGRCTNDFNHMRDLAPPGKHSVGANYSGVNFPTHLSPWRGFYFQSDWGQKNIAAFASKAFQDNYDFTGNTTFLREVAYPLLRLVGEFYRSYLTEQDGLFHVMHSCAMEGCGSQGPATSGNIAVSNNPPFDLAFVKRTFRQLSRYSAILQLDAGMRPLWDDIVARVAPYPLTHSEDGALVFAQATLNPTPYSTNYTTGFPNASHCQGLLGGRDNSQCGNARYPITHFNAMHPGEDVDLDAPADLVAIGRATTDAINHINDYSPTNGLCMAWPPAARTVSANNGTRALLAAFDKALRDTMMPNFIPFIDNRPTGGSGCNVEQSGATVAINDLLASTHGHSPPTLRILPGGWSAGQRVSFQNIRIKGAHLVSAMAVATEDGTIAFGSDKLTVTVRSLAGQPLSLYWPASAPPRVTDEASGRPIAVRAGTGLHRFSFDTTPNVTYILR